MPETDVVTELLAADCEKLWIYPGWEDAMNKWYEWLEEMKKKDEEKKMKEMHQQKVTQMMKSAEGSAGLLHKITKPTAWRGGAQILKKEEDARLLDRCEAKRKEWAKHWQCGESVENEDWKKWVEALPRLKCDLEKVSILYKAKNSSRL